MLSGAGSQGEAIPKKCSALRFHPVVSTLHIRNCFLWSWRGVGGWGGLVGDRGSKGHRAGVGGKKSFQSAWLFSL